VWTGYPELEPFYRDVAEIWMTGAWVAGATGAWVAVAAGAHPVIAATTTATRMIQLKKFRFFDILLSSDLILEYMII